MNFYYLNEIETSVLSGDLGDIIQWLFVYHQTINLLRFRGCQS
jgi:hypothetical protein